MAPVEETIPRRSYSIEDYVDSDSEFVGSKLVREGQMLLFGVGGAARQVVDDPLAGAPEVAASAGFGAGLKALQKRGTPGKVLTAAIAGAGAAKMAYDELTGDRWSTFGSALADNWRSKKNFEENVRATRDSVGALAVDMAVGTVAFKAAGLAAKPRENDALQGILGSKISESVASGLRAGQSITRKTFGTRYEFSTADVRTNNSWHKIYEAEFPPGERQPIEFLQSLGAPGAIPHVKLQLTRQTTFVDRVLGREGKTRAFSVTSDYGEAPDGRRLLMPYIAVDRTIQARKIGTTHLQNTLENLRREYPTARGMILEMEPTNTPGLTAAALEQRVKRLNFWTRNGGQVLDDIDYKIPSSAAGEPPIPLKLVWMDFASSKPTREQIRDITTGIYRHGYQLDDDDPLVLDFVLQFNKIR